MAYLEARKTPDTSEIRGWVSEVARRFDVPWSMVMFDRGGGGKQIADEMRRAGQDVRTVAFGEAPHAGFKRTSHLFTDRRDAQESKTAFVKRRAEMYWDLRCFLDPSSQGFAIPERYTELRRQMSLIPLLYNQEGAVTMPPKRRKAGAGSSEVTLTDLIGRSPDELDALVVAVHRLVTAEADARDAPAFVGF